MIDGIGISERETGMNIDVRGIKEDLAALEELDQKQVSTKNENLAVKRELDAAIKSGNLEDSKVAKQITDTKARLELFPARFAQIEEASQVALESLRIKLQSAGMEMQRAGTDAMIAARQKLATFLRSEMSADDFAWIEANIANMADRFSSVLAAQPLFIGSQANGASKPALVMWAKRLVRQ